MELTKSVEPFVTRTRFQDGYEQVVKFGLNINPKSLYLNLKILQKQKAILSKLF